MKYTLPFILLIFLSPGCSTLQICDDDNETVMVVRLKTISDGQTSDTILNGLSVWGFREGESLGLLYDSITLSRMILPLDPSATESSFILSNSEMRDTLVVIHDSEAYLISYECGFAMRFLLNEVFIERTWMQDVEIVREDVDAETETNEEHIRIYF